MALVARKLNPATSSNLNREISGARSNSEQIGEDFESLCIDLLNRELELDGGIAVSGAAEFGEINADGVGEDDFLCLISFGPNGVK